MFVVRRACKVSTYKTAMTVYVYPMAPNVSSLTLASVPKQIPASKRIR